MDGALRGQALGEQGANVSLEEVEGENGVGARRDVAVELGETGGEVGDEARGGVFYVRVENGGPVGGNGAGRMQRGGGAEQWRRLDWDSRFVRVVHLYWG